MVKGSDYLELLSSVNKIVFDKTGTITTGISNDYKLEILDDKGMLDYTIIPNYKIKEEFITENELKLYKVLKKVAYELKLDIFTQVALNRILEINNRRKQQQLRNRIDRKSIDFVLYDEKTKKIVCCIELDDSTHEREERIERDLFLDSTELLWL